MAFNLGAFGAGFASKATERLDEERVRAEKLIDENRQIATQQRLKKQASRDAEKILAEEMLGTLKALGLDDEQAGDVVSQGKGAFAVHETLGLKALEKGIPFSDLLNVNNNEIEGAEATLQQSDAAPVRAAGLGSGYWNNENVAAMYGKVPDKAISLDLQISNNAAQQLKLIQGATTQENSDKLNQLKEAEKFLMQKHAAMAANSREDSDTTKPITVTTRKTLEDLITKNHALESTKYGFGWDAEAQMEIAFSGNEGGGYSSLLSSVYKMEQTIGKSGDDWVNARLSQERKSIERGLNRHAAKKLNESRVEGGVPIDIFETFAEYEAAVKSGQVLKPGTVSFVGPDLYVFTGVPDPQAADLGTFQSSYTRNN